MNLPQSHSNVTTQFGCEPMTRHHQIHVWLNDQAHAALVRLARQNDETISTTVRRILQDYLHRQTAVSSADSAQELRPAKRS